MQVQFFKEKTIIVPEKQSNFLVIDNILCNLFTDDIWLSNQERSLFLLRLFNDS